MDDKMNDDKIKVLDISHYLFCPPKSGGALRMIMPFTKMGPDAAISVDILFASLNNERIEACMEYLAQYPIFHTVEGVIPKRYADFREKTPANLSLEVWITMSVEMRDAAIAMVKRKRYDIIQIEHSQMAWIVPYLREASPHSKFVLDLHNIEYLLYKRWRPYASDETKAAIENNYIALYEWEMKVWKWFDGILAVSKPEAQMAKELSGAAHVYSLPTGGGIDIEKYSPKTAGTEKRLDLLYLGTMEWFPNAQGLMWFLKEVFPLVIKASPDVTLNIVGFGRPDPNLIQMAHKHPSVKFLGEQADDIYFFHNAKVFIVPLWIAAGARVKIPTAWASKIPIVSTSIGAEGLNARHNENILIADTPEAFASSVLTLLNDTLEARRIAENAFETVQKEYSVQLCAELLNKYYIRINEDR